MMKMEILGGGVQRAVVGQKGHTPDKAVAEELQHPVVGRCDEQYVEKFFHGLSRKKACRSNRSR